MTTAAEGFTAALITLRDRGGRPPCTDPTTYGFWDSDDPASRAQAAAWCGPCPIAAQCDAYANEINATAGVWAGIDRGAGKPKPKPKPKRGERR